MSLKDINDNLFNPDSHIEERGHEKSRFDPDVAKNKDESEFSREKEWPEPKRGLTDFQKKVIKFSAMGLGIVLMVSVGLIAAYRIIKSSYENQKMAVEIRGPEMANSAEDLEYTITYQNKNWLKFSNMELFFDHSDNFQLTDSAGFEKINSNSSKLTIGKLSAGKKGEIKIKGKFFAPQDYIVYLRVTAKYTPSLFAKTQFESIFQLPVVIKRSPIKLDIEAPVKAASGQAVEYYFNYENVSDVTYPDIELRVEYPEEFKFYQSNPQANESNNIFKLGTLASGQKGRIHIEGTISGKANDSKSITVLVGKVNSENQFVEYLKQSKGTQMTGSPLMVIQKLGQRKSAVGSVDAGEIIYYQIHYKNLGNIGLRDVIVTLEFESEILDLRSMKLARGSFSSVDKKITWKAVDIPELANLGPGAEGDIYFNVGILKDIPVKEETDRNFTVESTARIDSPDIPTPIDTNKVVSTDTSVLKLNSPVALESKVSYYDETIPNSGPLPPRVGEETTYVIHWKIINETNDISDVKVVSSLPSYIKWKNVISPKDASLYFNERTNQFVWEVGKINNGSGIITPAKEIRFQVGITPEIYDVKKRPTIINEAVLSAKDMFSEEDIEIKVQSRNTELKDDSEASSADYSVE
jgi:hypothetical protein